MGCFIGRVHKPAATGTVTFAKDVARILNKHCVECHRPGEIGPFSLTSYDEAVGWADTIDEVVRQGRMPPWHADPKYGHFANDSRLSAEEKKTIADWIQAGTPEGDPKDSPRGPKFCRRLAHSEAGRRLHDSQALQSEGDRHDRLPVFCHRYRFHGGQMDSGGRGETELSSRRPSRARLRAAAERAPGSQSRGLQSPQKRRAGQPRRRPSGAPGGGNAARGGGPAAAAGGNGDGGFISKWLAATVPGARPMWLPEGMAKRVPAGSRLVIQIHYTATGAPQEDQCAIGLVFADPKTVRKEVVTDMVVNPRFEIPPGDPNYKVEAERVLEQDEEVLMLMPHTHVRGIGFKYEAIYPDGKKEVLLDVPHYDFNWQNTYVLAEPKLLPKGTTLRVRGPLQQLDVQPGQPRSHSDRALG